MDYQAKFDDGLAYDDFLGQYGTDKHRHKWEEMHKRIELTAQQQTLLGGFVREMRVLCLAGTWCGDCVNQCPIFDHFAQASECIQIRYFDRDDHPDLAAELSICGGARVPALLFLSEDGLPTGRYGDRTLSYYRHMAATQLGAACPTGVVPPQEDLVQAVTQDWLEEFERIQLILRTSPRLRKRHGD